MKKLLALLALGVIASAGMVEARKSSAWFARNGLTHATPAQVEAALGASSGDTFEAAPVHRAVKRAAVEALVQRAEADAAQQNLQEVVKESFFRRMLNKAKRNPLATAAGTVGSAALLAYLSRLMYGGVQRGRGKSADEIGYGHGKWYRHFDGANHGFAGADRVANWYNNRGKKSADTPDTPAEEAKPTTAS